MTVIRDPFANNEARIADARGCRQDLEVALGKIAPRVEIKNLAVRVKKRVLGVVAHG